MTRGSFDPLFFIPLGVTSVYFFLSKIEAMTEIIKMPATATEGNTNRNFV